MSERGNGLQSAKEPPHASCSIVCSPMGSSKRLGCLQHRAWTQKGAKQPSRLTQRRQDVFIPHLATRYSESRLIQRMLEVANLSKSFWNQENQENRNQMPGVDQHKSKCGGSWFTLGLDGSKETPGVKWKINQGRQCHIQGVIDLVYDHIVTNMSTNSSSRALRGFTEFKADVNGVRQIFRAHPSYRSRSRQQRD